MLLLSIINRRKIKNVSVKLKNAEKIREGVLLEDTKESEVLVSNKKFTRSGYNRKDSKNGTVRFIRDIFKYFKNKRKYYITTRVNSDSNTYDVYAVDKPKPKVNDALEDLYDNVVTDMRKEIPDIKRGRYISLKDLGFNKYLTDEKLDLMQEIIAEEPDQDKWPALFAKAGIDDLVDILDFIDTFDFTVVSGTTIPEDTLIDTINSLEPLQTRDYRNLKNYYKNAKENTEIYKKLARVHHMIYNSEYKLIRSERQRTEEKQKVMVKKENEVKKAA
ncbi:MAG: hypothetical protein IJF92_01190 [Bacilli bacterium]|nr:hypothetical protein [Bacilli bacterium]